jgi:hypothetical protein
MSPKKKSRRCRGLGLDSGLDLAITRFIYSFGSNPGLLRLWHCTVKKVNDFSVPSWDVTNQTLPGRESRE